MGKVPENKLFPKKSSFNFGKFKVGIVPVILFVLMLKYVKLGKAV